MIQFIALAALAAAQTTTPQTPTDTNSAPLQQAQPSTPPPAPIATARVAVPAPVAPGIRKGIVLWRNVEDGMSAAQLRAMYPQGPNVTYKDDRTILSDVPIIEGCQAKVNIMHPKGVVKEIVMRGEGAIAALGAARGPAGLLPPGLCFVRTVTWSA
jgi:hypothetical protein